MVGGPNYAEKVQPYRETRQCVGEGQSEILNGQTFPPCRICHHPTGAAHTARGSGCAPAFCTWTLAARLFTSACSATC